MISPDTNDTAPDAEEVLLQLIRNMTPQQCGTKAIRMTSRLISECKNAIRKRHPEFSEQQVGIAFIELNYGEELAAEVCQHLGEL